MSPSAPNLRRDAQGAVYVEFLIAFMPLLVFFSGIFQVTVLQVVDMITKHAATVGARAACVVLPDDPQYYGNDDTGLNKPTGARLTAIQSAVKIPLTAIDPSPSVKVTFPSNAWSTDNRQTIGPEEAVYVRVDYTHTCAIPIGNVLACGLTKTKHFIGVGVMPNQGADYAYTSSSATASATSP